jgi:hypothetical protein
VEIRLIMKKNLPLHLKEVIFSSKDPKISSQISNLLKTGAIRKIAPRVYSPNMDEPVEIIIRSLAILASCINLYRPASEKSA